PHQRSEAVIQAEALFRAWANGGQLGETADALLGLAGTLVEYDRLFAHARWLLKHAAELELTSDQELRLRKLHAIATYSDPEVRTPDALEHALANLGNLRDCNDTETLVIAGAVYRRMREIDGQRRHLELAYHCWRRSFELDDSYAGLNAA